MAGKSRKYRRTEAGRKAWRSRHSGLPPAYRRILGLVHSGTYSEAVFAGMRDYPGRQVQDWLDELETLCFIESLPCASARDSSRLSRAA